MLNLTIAMLVSAFLSLFLILQSLFSVPLVTPGLYITFPKSSSNVSGIVEIRGSVPVMNFASAEVAYAYADAGETNWFLIAKLDHAVQDDILGSWDTTTITDGTYQLRLSVKLTNGDVNEIVIKEIHVANYTHSSGTALPGLLTATMNELPKEATTAPGLQPTRIPGNPASMNSGQIKISIALGVIVSVLLLALLAIYNAVRNARKRR
jgi:hypothetical protein